MAPTRVLSILSVVAWGASYPLGSSFDVDASRSRATTPRLSLSALSALSPATQGHLSSLMSFNATQDCRAYALAYEFALRALPSRAPNLDVWNALRLGPDCGMPTPPSLDQRAAWPPSGALIARDVTFYVSPSGDDAADGSESRPFATLQRGVDATRGVPKGSGTAAIILRSGLHVLSDTIELDSRDDGIRITAASGEEVWISGGSRISNLTWVPVNVSASSNTNIWRASIKSPPEFMTALITVEANGSPSKRLYRAQFPNFNPEWHATKACGGDTRAAIVPECARLAAGSPFLRTKAPKVLFWDKPSLFPRPTVFFHNLSGEGLKNDSLMDEYNLYSAGRGGACGLWTNAWSENSSYGWDYHCGNVSAGGWEEVDELMQTVGQLNIPIGLTFDTNALPHMAAWKLNTNPSQRTNGASVINVWHTQGWFNNFLYVTGQSPVNASAARLDMLADDGLYPSGGWQGGRHWQTQDSFSTGGHNGPLLDGGWSVMNVEAELDSYDEYFFDPATNTLTVFYNASSSEAGNPFSPPTSDLTLMAPQLEVFFSLSNVTDVTISGLGFRDQRMALMDPWVVPSGGDWGLRPFGAITIIDSSRVTISDAIFLRLDANSIFVGGASRNVSILDSEFAWLGMSAVAALGTTIQDDATSATQPWGLLLSGLVVHEIGIYEKQSSAYFSGRTPLARVENCLFYNGPRAMLNLNDHLGGGNVFTTSLMFNTCRESSDHGNMNSWSRQPFMTNIKSGTPSYSPAKTTTTGMFIIANYGSSQGFDNDDGSNNMDTHHNFFYQVRHCRNDRALRSTFSCPPASRHSHNVSEQSDGHKGDYGMHDSLFHDNVVIVRPYDGQNCLNSWEFVAGHQDEHWNNTCVIMGARNPHDVNMVINQGDGGVCEGGPAAMRVHDNRYYTRDGNASVVCGGPWGILISTLRDKFPEFEARSTASTLPSADQVILWGREVLGL